MKKLFALILVVMLLSAAALAEGSYPAYINTDGYAPLIIEGQGGDDITLKITAYNQWLNTSDEVTDTWAWQYIQNVMGLSVEVEVLDANNLAERKNLMFASNDLPDMMIAMSFSTNELLNYGTINKQLAPLESYITEDLTPGIIASFERFPETLDACTAPDDSVYTLPFVYAGGEATPSALDNMAGYRIFVNTTWLDAVGLENPTTIDGYVDMLRAFKSADPAGVGSENVVPFGTCSMFSGFFMEVFSGAYGVIYAGDGSTVGMTRDGEVVVPAMEDYYLDYLTFMNTLYTEELISPDYFTMSDAQMRAMVAEGKSGVLTDWAHYLTVPDTYEEWDSLKPLVVSEGDTPLAKKGAGFAIGGYAMSSATQYPELCMRFIDYLFTPEGYAYLYGGPLDFETDLLMGVKGSFYDPEQKGFVFHEFADGEVTSGYEFGTTRIYPFNQLVGASHGSTQYNFEKAGIEMPPFEWNITNGDNHYRYVVYNATHDYVENGYPAFIYLTEEESQTITDIHSMTKAHIESESAKFIVGTRSLDEFEAFRAELTNMGIEEYIEIYTKAAS